MNVRFYSADGRVDATYDFGDARVPVKDENVEFDGSNPRAAEGEWFVKDVSWEITLLGHAARVELETLEQRYQRLLRGGR